MKSSLKYLCFIVIAYIVAGPLLLLFESKIVGSAAQQQAFPITMIAAGYLAYSLIAMSLIGKTAHSVNHPLGIFLLDNVARFFITCVALVVYAFIVKEGILLFGINLLAYYLITLAIICCFTVHTARSLNSSNSTKQA